MENAKQFLAARFKHRPHIETVLISSITGEPAFLMAVISPATWRSLYTVPLRLRDPSQPEKSNAFN